MRKLRRNFDARTVAKIHLSALVMFTLSGTIGLDLVILLGVTVVGVLAIVVWPAVWSRKQSRRDAALAVLDRVFKRS